MNKTIKLSPFLKDLIITKANEQNLAVDELIEKSINFYIEKNNITTSEIMDNFFKLPKSIRKIITKSFFDENEYYFESPECFFWDDDFVVLSIMMNGNNKNEISLSLSDEALNYFTNFLKEKDIFNTEI